MPSGLASVVIWRMDSRIASRTSATKLTRILLLLAILSAYPWVLVHCTPKGQLEYFHEDRSLFREENHLFLQSSTPRLPWTMKAFLEISLWTQEDWRKRDCEISLSNQFLIQVLLSPDKTNHFKIDVTKIVNRSLWKDLPLSIEIYTHHPDKHWFCTATISLSILYWEESYGFILNSLIFLVLSPLPKMRGETNRRQKRGIVTKWILLILSASMSVTGMQLFLLTLRPSETILSYTVLGGLLLLIPPDQSQTLKLLAILGCLTSLITSITYASLSILGSLFVNIASVSPFADSISKRLGKINT